MGKYDPLKSFLEGTSATKWRPTFLELERLIGSELPHSARKHPTWWSNETKPGHSQAHAWLDAGWNTREVNLDKERLTFFRVQDAVEDGEGEEDSALPVPAWAKQPIEDAAFFMEARPLATVGLSMLGALVSGLAVGLALGRLLDRR